MLFDLSGSPLRITRFFYEKKFKKFKKFKKNVTIGKRRRRTSTSSLRSPARRSRLPRPQSI
jgi:hypothetical protein